MSKIPIISEKDLSRLRSEVVKAAQSTAADAKKTLTLRQLIEVVNCSDLGLSGALSSYMDRAKLSEKLKDQIFDYAEAGWAWDD